MMEGDALLFADEEKIDDEFQNEPWKILIADDEESIHAVTKLAISGLRFEGRGVEFLSAFSEEEVKIIIKEQPDISLILLDVVMDSIDSGLNCVRHIRQELKNRFVRIILRTGQPGQAPENEVVEEYDINDYKEKTDLTAQKLRTAVISSLRSYRDLRQIELEQNKLKASKNYLDHIINSITSLLITVDKDLQITHWNETAVKETGLAFEEVIGKKLFEVTDHFKSYEQEVKKVLNTGKQRFFHSVAMEMKRPLWVNIYFNPIENDGVEGVVIRLDDITELREKDEQLSRSQKMEAIGYLAAGLAHDINNILGGITGSISLMEMDLGHLDFTKIDELKDINMGEYIETITESAGKASDLVKQLLALTKKASMKFIHTDLNVIVENVLKVCKNSFDKTIEIETLLTDDSATVSCDPAQIEQVILNICINASHALTIMRSDDEEQGGKLLIRINKVFADKAFCFSHSEAESRDYWCLEITDSGVGMDDDVITKIFDPFYTTKRKEHGTGLGLSMVYNIVYKHKGLLDIFSKKGQGTTVKIYLPAIEEKLLKPEKKVVEEIPEGSGLILLCDDENLMRRVATKLLEKCGYKVITAKDGQESIDVFKENYTKLDAVILDISMPKFSGLEVYRQIKKIQPDVKVLLSSGFGEGEMVKKALSEGVQNFLQKPYTMSKLANALKQVIGS